ncbi:MAG: hypothetical protein JW761_07425 [Prolixibacteraceae bacterium]|nr:hypothetical protein [Prolixibacteraceae bacterium]
MNQQMLFGKAQNKKSNCIGLSIANLLVFLFGLLCFTVFSSYSNTKNGQAKQNENLVLVCGDSKVLIVASDKGNNPAPQIIWSWDAHSANALPSGISPQKFNTIDDCKAINKGSQILVSSSSGAVALVNREDKKVIFYAAVPNAHSIEKLPGNKIVAAASTADKGNRLMLFDLERSDQLLFSDSLYSAHGVVWDKNRNSLFALGYDVLREYKMKQNDTLTLINEWKIPGTGGHDLQMAPGGETLFLTEHTGAWIFDMANEQFRKIDNFPDAENIKSINQNQNGRFVYTVPEESWWTFHVSFSNPEGILAFPDIHVYKARWLNP